MKKLITLLVMLTVAILGWYLWDLNADRSKTIKILKPTSLREEWESVSSHAIGNVEPGEKLKVLRIRYAKDHMAVKVERADGSTGWIIPDDSVEMGQ